MISSACNACTCRYHLSLVCSGLTTKQHVKGAKHGAKRIGVCQRIGCCAMEPTEVHPRRLVPSSGHSVHLVNGRNPPIISHHQL